MQELLLRLGRKQAAEVLGISTRHLDARTLAGQIKCVRDGARIFYTPQALRAYAQRDQVTIKNEVTQ